MKKRTVSAMTVVLFCAALTICCFYNESAYIPTIQYPELTDRGAYCIESVGMYFTEMADGKYTYSHYESKEGNGNRDIQLYVGPTEMILIEVNEGVCRYYSEKYEDTDQIYDNPLVYIIDSLKVLDFELKEKNADEYVFWHEAEVTDNSTDYVVDETDNGYELSTYTTYISTDKSGNIENITYDIGGTELKVTMVADFEIKELSIPAGSELSKEDAYDILVLMYMLKNLI